MASEKPLSIAWKKVKKEHNDEEQLHAIQEFVLYREDLASVTPYKRM
jgi:hypothetical protein